MKSKIPLLLLVLFAVLTSCQKPQNLAFDKIIKKSPYTVLMFFAPDCPLCITFSKPLNDLQENHPDIQFMAVQSGMHYEPMEIKMYKDETDLKAKIFLDRDFAVAKQFNIAVTPEFLLINQDGEVLYQGLLDDRMEGLGVYKQHWDVHYLKDALNAVKSGTKIDVAKTIPIGCVIEY